MDTPLMKQYSAIKAKYPGALLLFRVGDFYETFGEDAIKAAKVLDITLTKRGNGSASEIELAGFPHHALDTYLPKLVRAAFVVLTLALVATRIPINPARAEQKAPSTKDNPTNGDDVSLLAVKASNSATQTTNTLRILYSALRKAIVPSAMWFAIFFILSVPASCLDTQALFQTT